MRHDKAILGPGYFTREDILDFYGDVEGATRWERAKVYDSDDSSSDSSSCPDRLRTLRRGLGRRRR